MNVDAQHMTGPVQRVATVILVLRLERFFERISVITMKLTLGCNLKCTYCNTETDSPSTPRGFFCQHQKNLGVLGVLGV